MNKIQYLFLTNDNRDNKLHSFSKNITSEGGLIRVFSGFMRTLPTPLLIKTGGQLGLISIKILSANNKPLSMWNEYGNQILDSTILYLNSSCSSSCVWNSSYKNILHSLFIPKGSTIVNENIPTPIYHSINQQLLNSIEVVFTNQTSDIVFLEETITIELVFHLIA